ncbi:MAG TPA: tetratricopeptide repeat protein [Thermoanaerobaculia bacterium]|nr:tetratricopeptide repeat protein [Thermoanaerobaculia bacterium]
MRFRPLAAALIVTALAATAGVRAQTLAPRDIWPAAASSAREGDLESAEKRMTELVTAGRNNGIKTYPVYAAASAGFAREVQKAGKPDVADWARKAAERLDPKAPAVIFSNADGAAEHREWAKAIPLALRGFVSVLANYRTNVLGRADLTIVAVLALLLTATIFAISLFMRYGRSMAHDFREFLSARFRGGSVTVLAFALLFLPIFLWLGPLWLAFYWFIIFFGYATAGERVLTIVLLLLLAVAPLALDAAAHWIAGVDSPVVRAAISSSEQSYNPDALRRLQEVTSVAPDNAMLQVLLGNLQTFEGNDDQAAVHYRRAIELNKAYAGAHVNLGNLHFMNNEFQAAITEYEEAQRLDPKLAIAFYNNSVASGETYKFDQQAAMLEKARNAARDQVERLTRNPPPQKVVMYHPPLAEAWRTEASLAKRGTTGSIFGMYSSIEPASTVVNPVTLGALVSLLLAVFIWLKRRRAGYAGACIKCGRTFCYRCKSARESTTYCTQCIHIYLKRDGVSLDTKRKKLEEVTDYHSGAIKRNRLFATFLPGSAQMLEGRTASGAIGVFLFALFVAVAILVGRLAPALGPSANVAQLMVRATATLLAIITWLTLSLPVYRRRTAAV